MKSLAPHSSPQPNAGATATANASSPRERPLPPLSPSLPRRRREEVTDADSPGPAEPTVVSISSFPPPLMSTAPKDTAEAVSERQHGRGRVTSGGTGGHLSGMGYHDLAAAVDWGLHFHRTAWADVARWSSSIVEGDPAIRYTSAAEAAPSSTPPPLRADVVHVEASAGLDALTTAWIVPKWCGREKLMKLIILEQYTSFHKF